MLSLGLSMRTIGPQEEDFDSMSPMHQEYTTLQQRLESFSAWEGKVDKCELADAGMFFIGDGDRTSCFHCGIPLRQWESHDVPWIEHAKSSPCCEFVIFSKGLAYIKSALEFYEVHDEDFEALERRHRIENANSYHTEETSAAAITAREFNGEQCRLRLTLSYPRQSEQQYKLQFNQTGTTPSLLHYTSKEMDPEIYPERDECAAPIPNFYI